MTGGGDDGLGGSTPAPPRARLLLHAGCCNCAIARLRPRRPSFRPSAEPTPPLWELSCCCCCCCCSSSGFRRGPCGIAASPTDRRDTQLIFLHLHVVLHRESFSLTRCVSSVECYEFQKSSPPPFLNFKCRSSVMAVHAVNVTFLFTNLPIFQLVFCHNFLKGKMRQLCVTWY